MDATPACCSKCRDQLAGDRLAVIGRELAALAEGDDTVHRVKSRIRQLALMLDGLCAACAHHAAQREWHKCKSCRVPVYAPATRCPKCGGELYGVVYRKPEAA